MSVVIEGEPPLLLDLGTGVAQAPYTGPWEGFHATALVTHLHFDHVLGLPFFAPVHQPAARLDVFGPVQSEGSLEQAFAALVRPPFFPLRIADLRADLRFFEVADATFEVGRAKVTARPVPHPGPTVGYRLECDGKVVCYVSDHQAPQSLEGVADSVLELCHRADLLIHDAQYTRQEFLAKPDWGHCTVDYAALVAREAGVRRLCLFHHDPSRSDDQLDALVEDVRANARPDLSVFAAAQGQTLTI